MGEGVVFTEILTLALLADCLPMGVLLAGAALTVLTAWAAGLLA